MLGLGANWSFYDFDYSIVQLADRLDPGGCNADDFDLSPFEAQGGKLIMYQVGLSSKSLLCLRHC